MTLARNTDSQQAALGAGAPRGGFVVMVEFPVGPETGTVLETVQGLLDRIVSKQPGFVTARLHRGESGTGVINYMHWRDRASFDAFRAAHGPTVTEAIGRFGPQFRFFEIMHAVGAK